MMLNRKEQLNIAASVEAVRTTWRNIKIRCGARAGRNWWYYGSRGITLCPEWWSSFDAFFLHVGPKPSPLHSIDRINNDGSYEPGNVRWATAKEQAANRRASVRVASSVRKRSGSPFSLTLGKDAFTFATENQRRWLRAIRDHQQEKGGFPTYRALCARLGVRSTNAASDMIQRLVSKRLLVRAGGT